MTDTQSAVNSNELFGCRTRKEREAMSESIREPLTKEQEEAIAADMAKMHHLPKPSNEMSAAAIQFRMLQISEETAILKQREADLQREAYELLKRTLMPHA